MDEGVKCLRISRRNREAGVDMERTRLADPSPRVPCTVERGTPQRAYQRITHQRTRHRIILSWEVQLSSASPSLFPPFFLHLTPLLDSCLPCNCLLPISHRSSHLPFRHPERANKERNASQYAPSATTNLQDQVGSRIAERTFQRRRNRISPSPWLCNSAVSRGSGISAA